jgi:hypothetical protein
MEDQLSKHDVKIMDIKVDGRVIGQLVRKRTAREAFEEHIMCAGFRKQWNKAMESATQVLRVPIFEEGKDGKE